MDGYTATILDGMAQDLNTAGVGVYRGPTGTYAADERGVVFSFMPASPTQAIALTRYLDLPGDLAINKVAVQIRSRVGTNPLDGDDLVDQIRDTFHRRTNVRYGDLRFNLIEQTSFAPLGPDSNGRFEFTQNFMLTGNRYSS